MRKIKFFKQAGQMDCGATCLRIIADFYGRNYASEYLRELVGTNRDGASLLGLSHAAESIGFRTVGVKLQFEQLKQTELPCILYWKQNHFVVLHKIAKDISVVDPARGHLTFTENEFLKNWKSKSNNIGIALLLTPTPAFYESKLEKRNESLGFKYLFSYLFQYKKLIFQMILGLAVGSLLQLSIPFLTQAIVDVGISTNNLNFIYIILIAQLMLFFGRTSIDFIRSWILLHINTRINMSILTDFLIKLMKLPMSFFDTRMTGDILQRINDQKRIESFLTGASLNIIFSVFNLIIFTFALLYYSSKIFLIFLFASIVYSIWVLLFMKKRRMLDINRFDVSSDSQSILVQLISGMPDIKLNSCEHQKRWEWESTQAKLFKFNIKSLTLGQYQQAGAFFINEGKNILITFMVAKAVIDGNLTLGGMMALQYIVGQLNSPIEQMIGFLQQFQDAKLSLERLNDIHDMPDEFSSDAVIRLPDARDLSINIQSLNFAYPGHDNDLILKDLTLNIPHGKTTAVVGTSGSGKTTLLKILMRFYDFEYGEIKIGTNDFKKVSHQDWRSRCGVVMQEGFIFSDSIARNIAITSDLPDIDRLNNAIKIANLEEFIESLPLGLDTKIGAEGNGISQGQRQRILIARAVYKNPSYLFFDEATNALDANNENVIVHNMNNFFVGRTVVIVAHRLSTVKNADQIVVMERGEIVEKGTHEQLIKNRSSYFNLVKNQLELEI